MAYVTLTPYLTDYKTAKEAKEEYNAGKDFVLRDITSRWDGKPINKRQADEAGMQVTLRFCNLRKTAQG